MEWTAWGREQAEHTCCWNACVMNNRDDLIAECNDKHARLIAAAPDLLSALIDMVDDADDDGQSSRPMFAFARAAIAKATQP